MGITTFSQNKWGGRSDWSRPSITTTSTTSTMTEPPAPPSTNLLEEKDAIKISKPSFSAFGKSPRFTSVKSIEKENKPIEEPTVQISQPRFSVFGKKAKFDSINQKSLEQDRKRIEEKTISTVRKNKFELHLSTKSAANNKEQQDNNSTISFQQKKKSKKFVTFDPVFLERVCLFREIQSPNELKEAHDKRLLNPPFRIICPNWPPQQTSDYYAQKNILLNKKTFYVQPDNNCIKGKLMVRNLALDKSVSIRYTFDCWHTVRDVDAIFFGPNPKNIAFDIFEFSMDLLGFGQLSDRGELRGKLEFAIRFTAGDIDYCDNNEGRNYQIKIICDPLNDPWAGEKLTEKKEKAQANGKHVSEEEEEDEYPDEEEEEEDVCIEEETEEDKNEKHNSFTNALKGYKHAKPFYLNKRQPWLGTRYDFGQSLSLAKRAPYESWSNTVKADPGSITDYFLVKPISIKPTTPITAAGTVQQQPTPSSSTNNSSNISRPSSVVSFSNYYPQMSTTTSEPTNTITSSAAKVENEKEATTNISAPSYSKPMYMFSSASAPPSPRVSPTLPSASPTRPNLHQLSHSTSAVIPTLTASASPLDINSSYYLDLVNKYCFYNSNNNNDDDDTQQQLPISSI